MELATRRMCFAGLTVHPDEEWMLQIARNLTDAGNGFPRGKKYLLMDRDGKFSEAFRVMLEQGGVEAVLLPPRSPNLAAHIERIILFGERSLQNAVSSYMIHYPAERNHQGLDNRIIEPGNEVGCTTGERSDRLYAYIGFSAKLRHRVSFASPKDNRSSFEISCKIGYRDKLLGPGPDFPRMPIAERPAIPRRLSFSFYGK
jgi:hypothetical protein